MFIAALAVFLIHSHTECSVASIKLSPPSSAFCLGRQFSLSAGSCGVHCKIKGCVTFCPKEYEKSARLLRLGNPTSLVTLAWFISFLTANQRPDLQSLRMSRRPSMLGCN